jgi:hypothetical protein
MNLNNFDASTLIGIIAIAEILVGSIVILYIRKRRARQL